MEGTYQIIQIRAEETPCGNASGLIDKWKLDICLVSAVISCNITFLIYNKVEVGASRVTEGTNQVIQIGTVETSCRNRSGLIDKWKLDICLIFCC